MVKLNTIKVNLNNLVVRFPYKVHLWHEDLEFNLNLDNLEAFLKLIAALINSKTFLLPTCLDTVIKRGNLTCGCIRCVLCLCLKAEVAASETG